MTNFALPIRFKIQLFFRQYGVQTLFTIPGHFRKVQASTEERPFYRTAANDYASLYHRDMTRALIVEDNDTFRRTLRKMLRNNFPTMTLDEARDGTEALDLISTSCPDLVFMDIKLPGENGLQITKKIRGVYEKAKIIILTSHDYPEYREAARNYGANHFVSKGTSSVEEIVNLVRSLLQETI